MAIKRIKAKNFKSFKELDVELGDLNILIGANASGKSNFVDIFRFLRDIEDTNLNSAISIQGGFDNLRNINSEPSEPLTLEVVSDRKFLLPTADRGKRIVIEIYEIKYRVSIKLRDAGVGFAVDEESLTHKCNFYDLPGQNIYEKGDLYGEGRIDLIYKNGKTDISVNPPKPLTHVDIYPPQSEDWADRGSLLASSIRFFHMSPSPSSEIFGDIPIYDFDSKSVRKSAPIAAKAELEENGSNLAVVVKNIMESADGKRKLLNLVTYLLPFVDDLSVERQIDKSFLLRLRERYSEKYLPVDLISDGTIDMIALTVALYFGKESLAIIEEPDKGVHPHLISKAVHMMEDASRNKQIIITTHSPEVVKYANPDNLLLISRDKDGFSSVTPRPAEKQMVRTFLENEIGIEELYADSLLEM